MASELLNLDADDVGSAQFTGLRMQADEFLELPDDGYKYELLDGVVVMSPRATPPHQKVAGVIFNQICNYLGKNSVGEVFFEVDVHLGEGPEGGDLVYAPDVVFVRTERIRDMTDRIIGAPDLVVEVISRGSRKMDTTTKREDYQRFGASEYWIADPRRKSITFLRLHGTEFVEVQPEGDRFVSQAVPGFVLDLEPVRAAFRPW